MEYGIKEQEKERFRGWWVKRRQRNLGRYAKILTKLSSPIFPELSKNHGAVYAGLLQLAHHIIGGLLSYICSDEDPVALLWILNNIRRMTGISE